MIINCGIPRDERRALKAKAAHEYLSQWHPFFALWPRRIGPERCVWLEWIQRKGTWCEGWYYGGQWEFKYRLARLREAGL